MEKHSSGFWRFWKVHRSAQESPSFSGTGGFTDSWRNRYPIRLRPSVMFTNCGPGRQPETDTRQVQVTRRRLETGHESSSSDSRKPSSMWAPTVFWDHLYLSSLSIFITRTPHQVSRLRLPRVLTACRVTQFPLRLY